VLLLVFLAIVLLFMMPDVAEVLCGIGAIVVFIVVIVFVATLISAFLGRA